MDTNDQLAHPSLYGLKPDGSLSIFGQQCRHCGRLSFPRQAYGCEQCGAHDEYLEPCELSPQGTLISFAAVHRYRHKDTAAPFVIGQIKLVDGPFLRCTLTDDDETLLQVGAAVDATLVPCGDGSNKTELRFRVRRSQS